MQNYQFKHCPTELHPVCLDVQQLPPPEPMKKILSALAILSPNSVLMVSHRREPFPLYEQLSNLGFCFETLKLEEGAYLIAIWAKEFEIPKEDSL